MEYAQRQESIDTSIGVYFSVDNFDAKQKYE